MEEWLADNNSFVETRAAKHVLKCILENSCVTITASSGAGKTATLRQVVLKMAKEGYDIIPVTDPKDIVQFCNPNKKTLFVIDDFCGTYSINQSDLNNWEPVMENIKRRIQNKLTKIIVACRLQVYRDVRFESLSIFRKCVCDFSEKDLCLSQAEKQSIAEVYLEAKASEVIQYCDLYDCFPLLCKLYRANSRLSITDFFQNPFSVYETELDNLRKKRYFKKYCVLALCVMFDNRLEEEWFTSEVDTEKRQIIENTFEACRLDKGTSRLSFLDELQSLEHTFIKKEQNVYTSLHDKIFDFLVYYFGQNMIQCLIQNADSSVIRQRFLLDKEDNMNHFITILPPKYHPIYKQRMIDDWSKGKVRCVFFNVNMKIPEFRQSFLLEIKRLDVSFQRHLADTCDVITNETVLFICCFMGYIPWIEWCDDHSADANQCNSDGFNPLLISVIRNKIEVVKQLIDMKADINLGVNDGFSSLIFACSTKNLEMVNILLENNADVNQCMGKGISPLHVACANVLDIHKLIEDINAKEDKSTNHIDYPFFIPFEKNSIEVVKILVDHKADINKCSDDGESPLFVACRNNDTNIVKILLDNKADIDKCNNNGASPLFIASEQNYIELIGVLLENNADINKCVDDGTSPLLIACWKNNITVVKVLLNHKADTNKSRSNGASPLLIACQFNHTEIVKLLLESKADINTCNNHEMSPLLIACTNNHIDTMKLLLENKADINKCDKFRVTPLAIACANNNVQITELLLNNNADVNPCSFLGISPLTLAAIGNNVDIIKMLLQKGASYDILSSIYHYLYHPSEIPFREYMDEPLD